ncbi:hypothetical protein CDAR_202881 [Caerostris darwini]|uniref:Uncharacterized protein n=1 Tax=Caerostris darwini TaxID=1538125 RepID=A0AAV4RP06_9ARAC|nr:hypothetical protein CDAR_202881 [Caerostris darwini]
MSKAAAHGLYVRRLARLRLLRKRQMEDYGRGHAVGRIKAAKIIIFHSVILQLWKQLLTTEIVVRRPVAGRSPWKFDTWLLQPSEAIEE